MNQKTRVTVTVSSDDPKTQQAVLSLLKWDFEWQHLEVVLDSSREKPVTLSEAYLTEDARRQIVIELCDKGNGDVSENR